MVNWTCEQTEARLSDYLDRSLTAQEMAAFNAHVPACARCAPLVAGVSSLVSGLQSMEQVPEPTRLIYSILDKTLGPREALWRGWLRGLGTMRFAYGALSVAATLLVLVTASGFNWRHPKLADLQPARVYRRADSKAHLFYANTAEFVSNLRVVNEIQSRLRQDNELPTLEENTTPQTAPQKDPGHSDSSKPAAPRQQNRANGLTRNLEVLAAYLPTCRINASGVLISALVSRRML